MSAGNFLAALAAVMLFHADGFYIACEAVPASTAILPAQPVVRHPI
jgi:hypothetical protein